MQKEVPSAGTPAAGDAEAFLASELGALLMVAGLHGIAGDPAKLKHESGPEPSSIQTLRLAAYSWA